jgi:short-subunit dehydrogenase
MQLGTPSDFRGTVAVITGASSGIGRATALALARRGACVVLAARDADRLESVAKGCRESAVRTLVVQTDVSRSEEVEHLARAAIERFGHVDVWINNASVMAYGFHEEVPQEIAHQVISTNLLGTMYGCRAIADHFIDRQRGVIINIASLYAKMTSPYVTSYVTSKFGVLGFSEVLRQEFRRYPDIFVVTVLPASVDTPIFQHAANYTGRPIRAIPPVVDLDRVVNAILRSIGKPRAEVSVGVVGRLLALAHATAPPLYRAIVVPVMEHLAFLEGTSAHDPGNVCRPAPPFGRERGDWHEPETRRQGWRSAATLPTLLWRRGR